MVVELGEDPVSVGEPEPPEPVPEAVGESLEPPESPPVLALLGSRVPQLFLMSVVHASWAFLSLTLAAMQSWKACSQTNCLADCVSDYRHTQRRNSRNTELGKCQLTYARHSLGVVLQTGRRAVLASARERQIRLQNRG